MCTWLLIDKLMICKQKMNGYRHNFNCEIQKTLL